MRHLLVFGGSGFLGKTLCKAAIERNWKVSSISRSGKPPLENNLEPSWYRLVQWHKADIFDPKSYEDTISECTDIVHSLGILMERDYKAVFGAKSASSLVCKTFKLCTDDIQYSQSFILKEKDMTFEKINTQSGM